MTLLALTWDKGLNKDILPSELPDGYCSDAVNVRFRNGFAERVGGLLDATTTYLSALTIIPSYMELYTSTLSSTGRYLAYCGLTKVFADTLAQVKTEITRFSDNITIFSITRVGTTATLSTVGAHGRSNGDTVIVYGALPSQYNGTFVIAGVTATTFTYTMGSDPGASASPVGAYSTNAGLDFTGAPTDWTGGVLNGVLILNNATNGLYYWTGDTTLRMRKFPQSNISDAARPFKNYIVQLGSTVNGVKKSHNVAWSAAADPGTIPSSFTATATNDAGSQDIAETSGVMVDCMQWGDINILYKEDGRFGMQYIGGNSVFRFYRLPGSEGLLAKHCIANTPKGQVFMTANYDVMIHTGGAATSIAQGRVRSLLNLFAAAYRNTTFLAVNPSANEVWVVFPSTNAAGLPDTALIWNWDSDTWGRKNFSLMNCATSGLVTSALGAQYMLLSTTGTPAKIGLVDLATTDFGTTFTATVERQGITGGDDNSVKIFQRSRWQLDGNAVGPFLVSHGSAMTAQATPTYAASVSYTQGVTNFAAARATAGRFLAVKTVIPDKPGLTSKTCAVRTCEIDFVKAGTR